MAATLSLKEEKYDLIQDICQLNDIALVRKMKKYFARITMQKYDARIADAPAL